MTKKMLNLCAVLALIFAGGLLLSFDYASNAAKWAAIIAALACFALGLWLGHKLDKSKALPD